MGISAIKYQYIYRVDGYDIIGSTRTMQDKTGFIPRGVNGRKQTNIAYNLRFVFEREENVDTPTFSPFPTMFSILPNTNFSFSVTFICHMQMLSNWTGLRFCHLVKSSDIALSCK